MIPTKLVPAFQVSARAAVSAALAVAIAQWLRLDFPLYAMIGAVIVTDLTPAQTQSLGMRRLMGTLLGALVGASLSFLLPSGPLSIGISILLAMALSHILDLAEAAKVSGYVCAIIVLEHRNEPWSYALARLIETLLGIGVAWCVSLVPKLLRANKHPRS
jgi:uncharacterized membrane protein YgaE (UPF0421/DUF939 family)